MQNFKEYNFRSTLLAWPLGQDLYQWLANFFSKQLLLLLLLLLQSCPTLCDPIDGSPLGSSVPEILQAGILEWAAISFSNA